MQLPSFSRRILPLLAIAAIIATFAWVISSQPDRTLQTPERKPPEASRANGGADSVAGSGVIEPSSEITDIGTNISGLVAQVHVSIGERVTRGQPLFTVDTRQARAALGEAEAGMADANAGIGEAQAALATAQRQLALYQQVDDPRAISRAEVIAAEGEVARARERLASARSALVSAQARRASAQTTLERHTVLAPISGEVLDVEIRAGELVSAGGQGGASAVPYIQLGETQPLFARIDIDENEMARVAVGGTAIISPRGMADRRVAVSFVRAEPQIVPKRSLTNSASERVDVRVMQLIYALPAGTTGFRVGQQIDAFVQASPPADRAQ